MCRDEARYESLQFGRRPAKRSRDVVNVSGEGAHLPSSNSLPRTSVDVVRIDRTALASEGPRAEEKARASDLWACFIACTLSIRVPFFALRAGPHPARVIM